MTQKNSQLRWPRKALVWFLIVSLVTGKRAKAFFDFTGPAQVMYLSKILVEDLKRFQQLQQMLASAKGHDSYIRALNQGLDSVAGIIRVLPIQDEKVLAQFSTIQEAARVLNEIYGIIPQSTESLLQKTNDQTIAESIKMISRTGEYAERQEENAMRAFSQGDLTSPKGAMRMTAQMSAQILHTLNQILKVNAQILKVASTNFATENKEGKRSVNNFNRLFSDLDRSIDAFKGDLKMPRFQKEE